MSILTWSRKLGALGKGHWPGQASWPAMATCPHCRHMVALAGSFATGAHSLQARPMQAYGAEPVSRRPRRDGSVLPRRQHPWRGACGCKLNNKSCHPPGGVTPLQHSHNAVNYDSVLLVTATMQSIMTLSCWSQPQCSQPGMTLSGLSQPQCSQSLRCHMQPQCSQS